MFKDFDRSGGSAQEQPRANKADELDELQSLRGRELRETNGRLNNDAEKIAEGLGDDLHLGKTIGWFRGIDHMEGMDGAVSSGGLVKWNSGALLHEWALTMSGEHSGETELARYFQIRDFPGLHSGELMNVYQNFVIDNSGSQPVAEMQLSFQTGAEAVKTYSLRLLMEQGSTGKNNNVPAQFIDFVDEVAAEEVANRLKIQRTQDDGDEMVAGN